MSMRQGEGSVLRGGGMQTWSGIKWRIEASFLDEDGHAASLAEMLGPKAWRIGNMSVLMSEYRPGACPGCEDPSR